MKFVYQSFWREDEGVLSFEWVLIITLLVIGTVGALSGVRDAINIELGGVAGAAAALDKSYSVGVSGKHQLGTAFSYTDTKANIQFARQDGTTRQPAVVVDSSK